jgi:hypothetical protein
MLRQHIGSKQSAIAPGWYSKSIWISLKCKIRIVGDPGVGGIGGIIGGLGTLGSVIFQSKLFNISVIQYLNLNN